MSIPVSRFSRSPLESVSVATLRRWYWAGYHGTTEIHKWAIFCELESRDYPVDDWPVEDPFSHFTTEELTHLPLKGRCDLITACAIRDEINRRGEENRANGIHVAPSGEYRGTHRYGFFPY